MPHCKYCLLSAFLVTLSMDRPNMAIKDNFIGTFTVFMAWFIFKPRPVVDQFIFLYKVSVSEAQFRLG
jgi:hypothetical protein